MNQKRVLITAGASGIGLEIARAFAASGADVFICDIDAGALAASAAEIPEVKSMLCDIAERQQVQNMVAAAAAALGGIDVLINNAGRAGPTAPVQDIDPDEWDAVLRVNLTGTFNVTRLAIPHLKLSPAGVIINMSGLAGRCGYPNRGPYAATKWALVGFTKTLSRELGGFGIRANALLPGPVEGDRIRRVFEERAALAGQSPAEIRDQAMAFQSIKRLVDPAEIGALCVFLASDAGRSISGQALAIDNDAAMAA